MTTRFDADRIARELGAIFEHEAPSPSFVDQLERRLAEQARDGRGSRRWSVAIPRPAWMRPSLRRMLETALVVVPILLLSIALWKMGIVGRSQSGSRDASIPASTASSSPTSTLAADSVVSEDTYRLTLAEPIRRVIAPGEIDPTEPWDAAITITVAAALAGPLDTVVRLELDPGEPAPWDAVRGMVIASHEGYPFTTQGTIVPRVEALPMLVLPDGGRMSGRWDWVSAERWILEAAFPGLPDGVARFALELGAWPDTILRAREPWRFEVALEPMPDVGTPEAQPVGARAVAAGMAITVTDVVYYPDATVVHLLGKPTGVRSIGEWAFPVAAADAYVLPVAHPLFYLSAAGVAVPFDDSGRLRHLGSEVTVVAADLGQAVRVGPAAREDAVLSSPVAEVAGADASRDGFAWTHVYRPVSRDEHFVLEHEGWITMCGLIDGPFAVDLARPTPTGDGGDRGLYPVTGTATFGPVTADLGAIDLFALPVRVNDGQVAPDDEPGPWLELSRASQAGSRAMVDRIRHFPSSYLTRPSADTVERWREVGLFGCRLGDRCTNAAPGEDATGIHSRHISACVLFDGYWLLSWDARTGVPDVRPRDLRRFADVEATVLAPVGADGELRVRVDDTPDDDAVIYDGATIRLRADPAAIVRDPSGARVAFADLAVGNAIRIVQCYRERDAADPPVWAFEIEIVAPAEATP